jgi:hypothetical protein
MRRLLVTTAHYFVGPDVTLYLAGRWRINKAEINPLGWPIRATTLAVGTGPRCKCVNSD